MLTNLDEKYKKLLSLLMVIFGVYGIGFDATQFIYNQF